jgi:hypothetical protein
MLTDSHQQQVPEARSRGVVSDNDLQEERCMDFQPYLDAYQGEDLARARSGRGSGRDARQVVKARYSAEEAQVHISEAATGVGDEMADVGAAMQRAIDKTDEMEARPSAVGELEAAGTFEDLTTLGPAQDDVGRQLEHWVPRAPWTTNSPTSPSSVPARRSRRSRRASRPTERRRTDASLKADSTTPSAAKPAPSWRCGTRAVVARAAARDLARGPTR